MLRIILTRPGSTEFDEQGRIMGTLSIPLSEQGIRQVAAIAGALLDEKVKVVYSSPCEAAIQTADALAEFNGLKVKQLDKLQNLNQGLWQGKLIDDVRTRQPKVYRQWQEHPESVCPPEGEMIADARQRVQATLAKLLKKHKDGVIALVVPEPLASLIRSDLSGSELGDLWQAECACGNWESIDIQPEAVAVSLGE